MFAALAFGLVLSLSTDAVSLLRTCAPDVGVDTMAAIVQHESGWNPYAIGDNTTRQSYFPSSALEASRIASELLARGHSIDAGMAQINSQNWRSYHLDAVSVFEPCNNIRVGSRIIWGDYMSASSQFGPGLVALWHALQAYNSGSFYAARGYADAVFAIGQRLAFRSASSPLPARTTTRQNSHASLKRALPQQAVSFMPAHYTPESSPILSTGDGTNWSTKR